jgi:hypothetical protein
MEDCRNQVDSGILSHRGSATVVEEAGSGLNQAESGWVALARAADRSLRTTAVEVVRTDQVQAAGHSHSFRELAAADRNLHTAAEEASHTAREATTNSVIG